MLDVDVSARAETAWLKEGHAKQPRNLFTDRARLEDFVRQNRLYFPNALVETLSSIVKGIYDYDEGSEALSQYTYEDLNYTEYNAINVIPRLEKILEDIGNAQRATEVQFKQLLGAE